MTQCQVFNLACSDAGQFAIFQGASYNCLTLYYEDVDLSSYTPLGQIRDGYAANGGNILATFSFEPLAFGSVTIDGETFNATTIIPKLTATETEAIPATLNRPEGVPFILGINAWTYDIKLIDPAETIIVARGFVEVVPDTSRL